MYTTLSYPNHRFPPWLSEYITPYVAILASPCRFAAPAMLRHPASLRPCRYVHVPAFGVSTSPFRTLTLLALESVADVHAARLRIPDRSNRLSAAGIPQRIRRQPLHDIWHRQLKAPWNVETDESAPDGPAILKSVRGTTRD
jgi:hypothetical protein